MTKVIIPARRCILDFKEEDIKKQLLSGFGAGGLAQGMLGILKRDSPFEALWVGSSVGDADERVLNGEYDALFDKFRKEGISPNSYPDVARMADGTLDITFRDYLFSMVKIGLPKMVEYGHYDECSNSSLWGPLHYTTRLLHKELPEFPEPRYKEVYLDHYIAANVIFADGIAKILRNEDKKAADLKKEGQDVPDIVVWFQDYHLMRAPMTLRDEVNLLKARNYLLNIKHKQGQFMHTPFPDVVNVLSPYFKEHPTLEKAFVKLYLSMLGNDFNGFQTPTGALNFARAVEHYAHFLPEIWDGKRLEEVVEEDGCFKINHKGNGTTFTTRAGAYPIGVDARRILPEVTLDKKLKFKKSDIDLDWLIQNEKRQNRIVFGGVERYDFTKGIPRKLKIFGEYMKLYGNARLVQITEPSRETSEVYKILPRIVHAEVDKLNADYGKLGYNVVTHRREGIRPPENYRFMRDVDVLMITPEEDGQNIVVYEGILSKKYLGYQDRGIIVLGKCGASETLGDFGEEGGIVRVDQLNPIEAAQKIKHVLDKGHKVSDGVIDYVKKDCRVSEWAKKNIYTIRTGEYLGDKKAA